MDNPITVSLPQDLPTNWTYGQTVAPTGAQAGLAEQYGYNYLMEQVNAAQQAASELGEAFTGAASQTNLTSHINNKSNPHNVTASQVGADPAGSAAAVQSVLTPLINEKSQISAGSYVGTGTYGADNPNTLTFPFATKVVMFLGYFSGSQWMPIPGNGGPDVPMDVLTTAYQNNRPPYFGLTSGGRNSGKKSSDGRSLSWFSTSDSASQLNYENYIYYYIAIG